MSALRKIGGAFAGIFFVLAMMAAISIYSLVNFTQYENVKGVMSQLVQQQSANSPLGDENQRTLIIEGLKEKCLGKESIQFSYGAFSFDMKCSEADSLTGEKLNDFISEKLINGLYYKKYSCDFVSCLRSGEQMVPLVITDLAHQFYQQILNYAVIATVFFGALFVIAAEGTGGRLKSLGKSLVWSSGPFVAFSLLLDKIANYFIPNNLSGLVTPVLSNFFAPTLMIYIYLLAAGIVLLVSGYAVLKRTASSAKEK